MNDWLTKKLYVLIIYKSSIFESFIQVIILMTIKILFVITFAFKKIMFSIDNSRTGLDTSNNQCSAPAVTALKKLLVVLLETSYYSGIRRKQDGEMCCSEMSVRILPHKEGKKIDDEGNHTFLQETCVCLSKRKSNKETLVISYSQRCRFI